MKAGEIFLTILQSWLIAQELYYLGQMLRHRISPMFPAPYGRLGDPDPLCYLGLE